MQYQTVITEMRDKRQIVYPIRNTKREAELDLSSYSRETIHSSLRGGPIPFYSFRIAESC